MLGRTVLLSWRTERRPEAGREREASDASRSVARRDSRAARASGSRAAGGPSSTGSRPRGRCRGWPRCVSVAVCDKSAGEWRRVRRAPLDSGWMRRRVTFSRNVTLSLSRTCVSHCKYCAFQTHRPHLHAPDEVEALHRRRGAARRQGAAGADGRRPGAPCGRAGAAGGAGLRRLRRLRGVVLRARAGAGAAAAHQPRRAVARGPGAAARGDGVAGADAGVDARRTWSRIRARRRRIRRCGCETIRAAGELRIPFTSGILVGIGETEADRVAALEALAAVHAEHGHLQEVILQNFVPHRPLLRRRSRPRSRPRRPRRYWRTGLHEGPAVPLPAWAQGGAGRSHRRT